MSILLKAVHCGFLMISYRAQILVVIEMLWPLSRTKNRLMVTIHSHGITEILALYGITKFYFPPHFYKLGLVKLCKWILSLPSCRLYYKSRCINGVVSLCSDLDVLAELMSRTKNNYYNIVSQPLYCSTNFACNFTLICPIISVIILLTASLC